MAGARTLKANIADSCGDTKDPKRNNGHHARVTAAAKRRVVEVKPNHVSLRRVTMGRCVECKMAVKKPTTGTEASIAVNQFPDRTNVDIINNRMCARNGVARCG